MLSQVSFASISDVVWQGIITNVFWLTIFSVIVIVFRREIRFLLGSLASIKLAGASFELRDKRATLEYYAILTDILVEILSQRDSANALGRFISDASARQLARFTLKYSKEVPQEYKEIELLKNVALIVGRKGNIQDAMSFYDALLKQTPGDRDLLTLKANLLSEGGVQEDVLVAQGIYDDLVKRFPNMSLYRFNRALNEAKLQNYEQVIADLNKAMDLGYWKRNPKMLEAIELQSARESKEDDFKLLDERLNDLQRS